MKVGHILCTLGIHSFEDEPSQKELLKETGLHIGLWTQAVQKGTKKCQRGCGATQKVYREGLYGIGGAAGAWRRLDAAKERYIDYLPGPDRPSSTLKKAAPGGDSFNPRPEIARLLGEEKSPIAPAQLPDQVFTAEFPEYPRPWIESSRGNGHFDVTAANGAYVCHVHCWDATDRPLLSAKLAAINKGVPT